MKKLLSFFASMLIAIAATAQTATENLEKGIEAYNAGKYTEAVSFIQKAANQGNEKAIELLKALK